MIPELPGCTDAGINVIMSAEAAAVSKDFFRDYLPMKDYRQVGKNVYQKGEGELIIVANRDGKWQYHNQMMPKDAGSLLQFVAHRFSSKLDINPSTASYLHAAQSTVYIMEALHRNAYVPKPMTGLMEKGYLSDLYVQEPSGKIVEGYLSATSFADRIVSYKGIVKPDPYEFNLSADLNNQHGKGQVDLHFKSQISPALSHITIRLNDEKLCVDVAVQGIPELRELILRAQRVHTLKEVLRVNSRKIRHLPGPNDQTGNNKKVR